MRRSLVARRVRPFLLLGLGLFGCGGVALEPASEDLAVPDGFLEEVAPPGDAPWTTMEAHAGAMRSVPNTVPWYPEALRSVPLRERVLAETVRYAGGRLLAAGKEVVYVIDPKTGVLTDFLCIGELHCGDGDDTDMLAHIWDPWTTGGHLWIDPEGPRAIFLDAVDTQISNDLWVKVWDLDALPGDGRVVDATRRFAVPKTSVNTWLLGTWVDGGHLVVYYRDQVGGAMVPYLDAYSLEDGQRVSHIELSYDGDPAEPDSIDHITFSQLRIVWPQAVWVDKSGQRLAAWDLSQGDLLWHLPETPTSGTFEAGGIFASSAGVFSLYGDTSGDPSVLVRYGWDGTREGACPELAHGIAFPHWAALSPDGGLVVSVGATLGRVRREACAVDELAWGDLASDSVFSDLASKGPGPQRSAFAGSTALLGVTVLGETPETYVLVWPAEADRPVGLAGPVPVAEVGQERRFVVAGHRLVVVSDSVGQMGTHLEVYGDETPPSVGEASLAGGERVRFEVADAGGPPFYVGLLYAPLKGGEVRWVPAAKADDAYEVAVTEELGQGRWRIRPVAVDLSGNLASGATYRLTIP